VWSSHHGISCSGENGCIFHEYPFYIQNPVTYEQQEIADSADLHALLLEILQQKPREYSIGQHLYFNLIGMHRCICPELVREDWCMDIIRRFVYCRDHLSVTPFEGGYDRQPAWWLDASAIIAAEVSALAECSCFKCKLPRGRISA